MKLIGSLTSPFVRKVRVVLAEKKLDYKFEVEDVWAADTQIMQSNPLGKVPCLVMEGGEAIFVAADVGKPAEAQALVARAVVHYGRLDIACNNAGIAGPTAPTADYPLNGWTRVLNINLSGVFYGMQAQIEAMLKHGGGSIVNIASVLGAVGFTGSVAYTAAKHGVVR